MAQEAEANLICNPVEQDYRIVGLKVGSLTLAIDFHRLKWEKCFDLKLNRDDFPTLK